MATIQPSIGPARSDFYYRTPGATGGSFIVPREDGNVIARQPGYLIWAKVEILASYGAPVWIFFFDANQNPNSGQPGEPDATSILMPPTKVLPGVLTPIVPPYESITVWSPSPEVQDCQQFGQGRRPILAYQEPKGQPCDAGLTYALSTSDTELVPPNGNGPLAYMIARYRNETR